MTIKEILTTNRDSIISEIRYQYRHESLKDVMVRFLAYAQKHSSEERMNKETSIKSYLRYMVREMKGVEMANVINESMVRNFGTKHPKQSEIIANIEENNY